MSTEQTIHAMTSLHAQGDTVVIFSPGAGTWCIVWAYGSGVQPRIVCYSDRDEAMRAWEEILSDWHTTPGWPVEDGLPWDESPIRLETAWYARCGRCGETFNPDGPADAIHVERVDGVACGGIARGWDADEPIGGGGMSTTHTDKCIDRAAEAASGNEETITNRRAAVAMGRHYLEAGLVDCTCPQRADDERGEMGGGV